jgi:3-hydroxyisobutyrate dehydrogenase-like beta-hydroxyacid dehydrogenase
MTEPVENPQDAAPRRPTTGFIGLGMMGVRVAANLMRAGHPLVVYNRTAANAEPLLAAGASWAGAPVDVGRRVGDGVLFTMVTDYPALEAVLFGSTGALEGLRPGALVVDLSTIGPDESRSVAARLAGRGVAFVDAPVGGSIDAAEARTLLVFVGGAAADVERARPMLEVIGRRAEHFGPVGAGASAKLVNNLLMATAMAALGEAVALGDAFGLDRGQLLEILALGGAGSKVLDAKRENVRLGTFPARFKLSLARKDLRLAERAARAAALDLPVLRAARGRYDHAAELGRASDDYSAVAADTGAPVPRQRRGRPRAPRRPHRSGSRAARAATAAHVPRRAGRPSRRRR